MNDLYRPMHVPLKRRGSVWRVAAMGNQGWSTKAGPGIDFKTAQKAELWIRIALPIRDGIRDTPLRDRGEVDQLLSRIHAPNIGFLRMLQREGLSGDWRRAAVATRIEQLQAELDADEQPAPEREGATT